MGRKGKRVRLGQGLWSDDGGLAATVRVGSQPQREKRFKRTDDFDADLRKMKRWQLHTRAQLLGDELRTPSRDTLADAVPSFLATMPEGSARRDYEKLLATWLETPLGPMLRSEIHRRDVLMQLANWEGEGYAAGTLNHRLRALRKLFDVLDADDDRAINPCAKVRKRAEPEPEERGADYAVLEGILAQLPDIGYAKDRGAERPAANKSKIRLRIMAWTGLPPALVKKIREEHVDWHAKELLVTPRRKGKGVKARRLPLLDEAVAALRDLKAAGGFESYSNAAPWAAWQRAKKRYLAAAEASGMPAGELAALRAVVAPLRPYDLRHSFAAMVYETTENQYAVKDLLMHGNIQTSERYIKRAVIKVSQSAIAAVAAARAVPASASTPSDSIGLSRTKRAISLVAVHSKKAAKPRVSSKK